MTKLTIIAFLTTGILTLSVACGNHEQHGETLQMIDLRDYQLPIDKLLDGKVFCYSDSSGQLKKYEKLALDFMGDTLLTSTEYDSAGNVSTIERVAYSGDDFVFRNSEVLGIELKIDHSPISWRQPVNIDSSGFKLTGKMAIGPLEATIKQIGFYSDLKDSAMSSGYPLNECILQTLSSKMEASMELDTGNKQLTTVLKFVWAKGVGKVYQRHEVPGKETEVLYLSEIISVPALHARFPNTIQ